MDVYEDVDFDDVRFTDNQKCKECLMADFHKMGCSQRYHAEYYPDAYQFIRIRDKDFDQSIVKLFSVWVGGYSGTDSWRINSGVTGIEVRDNKAYVHGHSGSVYCIDRVQVHMSGYGQKVLNSIIDKAAEIGTIVECITLQQAVKELKNV